MSAKSRATAEKSSSAGTDATQSKAPDSGEETDNSTLSNASVPSSAPASSSKPSKPVVDFAETGVQLPVGISTLVGVPSGAIEVGTGTRQQVPMVTMRMHCPGNLGKIKRILNLYIIMPSYSRLHNVFTSEPNNFQLNPVGHDQMPPKSWRIGTVGGDKTMSFYILSRVAKSELALEGQTKTISIQVIERFWPCIASFLVTVLNMDTLLVPCKDGGVCFSSFKQGSTDWTSTAKKPGRGDNGPDVRSWKVPVPVFDGRDNFKLKEYWDLNLLRGGEVAQHSMALVIFTVGRFMSQNSMHVSLNVQSVVALANRVSSDWTHEPDPNWHPSLLEEKALGITRVVAYEPQDDREQPESSEEEDGDNVGIL